MYMLECTINLLISWEKNSNRARINTLFFMFSLLELVLKKKVAGACVKKKVAGACGG